MIKIQALLSLQKEKYEQFLALEAKTHRLLACYEEEMAALMEERQLVIGEIDRLSEQIKDFSQEHPAFLEAASNQCERDALSEPLRKAYDMALEIRAASARISELSIQVTIRMESSRDHILEKIKTINSGAMAQASKYHQPINPMSSFQSEV